MKTLSLAQRIMLPVVVWINLFLTALLLILLAFFVFSIFLHSRRQRYFLRHQEAWARSVAKAGRGEGWVPRPGLATRARLMLSAVFIDQYRLADDAGRERIRRAYIDQGLLRNDLRQLRQRAWWKKVQAMERLGALGLAEAEADVLALLADRHGLVRLSALDMLSHIRSRQLGGRVAKLFEQMSRWEYRAVVNSLFRVGIDIAYLEPLIVSPERDLRKAAAVLLGQPGAIEAIGRLRVLIGDPVKDVRREAVRACGRIGGPGVFELLKSRLDDREAQVRAETAKACSGLAGPEGLAILRRLALDDDFEVRLAAFFALGALGPQGKEIIRGSAARDPEMVKEFLGKTEDAQHAA